MNINSIFSIIATAVLVVGCTSKNVFLTKNPIIRSTAAAQALGPGAISTALVIPGTIQPGRIYHEGVNGELFEICENDIREQNALKAMKISTVTRPKDEVEDQVYQFSVDLPWVGKARPPYERVKVTGYAVSKIAEIGNVPDYVLQNVAKNCRNKVLPRNLPYFVTSAVAVADKAETFSRNFVDSAHIAIFEIGGSGETKGPVRSDVIFATDARKYER